MKGGNRTCRVIRSGNKNIVGKMAASCKRPYVEAQHRDNRAGQVSGAAHTGSGRRERQQPGEEMKESVVAHRDRHTPAKLRVAGESHRIHYGHPWRQATCLPPRKSKIATIRTMPPNSEARRLGNRAILQSANIFRKYFGEFPMQFGQACWRPAANVCHRPRKTRSPTAK